MDGGGGEQSGVRERLALAGMFGAAALRYWTGVFPGVCRELARWRRRAGEIADPVLRGLALEALGKRGNIEGAAAFAAFVPRSHRNLVLRAVVAFQTAYNYLDLLAEQPSPDPAANARRLHEALLVALDPAAAHPDYYEHNPQHDDDGYLSEIVEACRGALGVMPSYAAVALSARRAATRIVEFQSLGAGEPAKAHRASDGDSAVAGPVRGEYDALERWARAQTLVGDGGVGGLLAVRVCADRGRRPAAVGCARDHSHRTGLFPLDRGAALAAGQPRRRRRGSCHRAAQPDRLLRIDPGSEHADAPACGTLAASRAGIARRQSRFDSGGNGKLLSRHARSLCPSGAPRGPCCDGSARRTGRAGAARLPPPHAP